MKYLGILVIAVLVLAGSVAMANNYFQLEGNEWNYPPGPFPATIELKVTVAQYYAVRIPKPILHWHVDSPEQPGTYEASTPGTMEVTANYNITFQFYGFKDPVHKQDSNWSIPAWWKFLQDDTVVQDWFRAKNASPFNITVPGDGVKHVISFYSRIEIPQTPMPKAGVYSDSDLTIECSPTEGAEA